ncbi:MAG: hypothetical protein H7067_10130 [Burkholderiales bacterium]|nr:hypothetical protein [Opitutaceae bacterium]
MSEVAASLSQLVYVILGAPGSGRREVLTDLIGAGLDAAAGERAHVFLPAGEPAQEADEKTGAATVARMRWDADLRALFADAPPTEATHVFIVFDGLLDPVDQIEAVKPWLAAHELKVSRIFTVLHCQLAEKNPALKPWFDACVHFSDIVLLNRREGVANKWLSDFRGTYEDQHIPCLFEFVKAGKVKNPAMLLDPVARRLSQYFDESEWDDLDLDGIEIGESEDEDGENAVPIDKNNIDPDDQPPVEIYLERRQGGRRVIELPDIREYLK